MKKLFTPIICIPIMFAALVSGCEKTPTGPSANAPHSSVGIYIANEGDFQKSTASLSYYDFENDSMYADVFRSANGRGLGDVANDMKVLDSRGYIVVNNSDRIEVIDTRSNKSVGIISFPTRKNPGFLALVDATHGYCANYDGTISRLDPSALSLTSDSIGSVQFPGGIATVNGKVYVSDAGFGGYPRTVTVFNAASGAYMKKIDVGFGPGQMAVGIDGKLYIICSGINDYFNPQNRTDGALFVVDPSGDVVTDSVRIADNPADIAIDSQGAIYTRGSTGIMRIVRTGGSFTVTPSFIAVTATYSLCADPTRDKLYVGRLTNSSGSGELVVYSLQGEEQKRVPVGIFPGTIVVNE